VLVEQNKLLKHLLDASEAAKAGRRAKLSSTETVNEWRSLWDKPRAERPGWRERLTATIAPTVWHLSVCCLSPYGWAFQRRVVAEYIAESAAV
jgi:hypothetical protein